MYFIRENSQKLRQNCKWALWMSHLVCRVLAWDQSKILLGKTEARLNFKIALISLHID
jgi:hypothetical protein